jgi:hypothetical protein
MKLSLSMVCLAALTFSTICRVEAQSNPGASAAVYRPSNGEDFWSTGGNPVRVTIGCEHSYSFSGVASTTYPASFESKCTVDSAGFYDLVTSGNATTNQQGNWAYIDWRGGDYTAAVGSHIVTASSYLVVNYDVADGPHTGQILFTVH